MLEGLIKAGAFDSTGGRRSQFMAVLDQAVDEGAATQKERELRPDQHLRERAGRHDTQALLPIPRFPMSPSGIRRID